MDTAPRALSVHDLEILKNIRQPGHEVALVDELLAHYSTWLSYIHEDDVPVALQNLKDHLEKRSEGFKAEYRASA